MKITSYLADKKVNFNIDLLNGILEPVDIIGDILYRYHDRTFLVYSEGTYYRMKNASNVIAKNSLEGFIGGVFYTEKYIGMQKPSLIFFRWENTDY